MTKFSGHLKNSIKFTKLEDNYRKEYILDLKNVKIIKKRVRPIEKQNDYESRKIWKSVTDCLKIEDYIEANKHKTKLENLQRTRNAEKDYLPKVRMVEIRIIFISTIFNSVFFSVFSTCQR